MPNTTHLIPYQSYLVWNFVIYRCNTTLTDGVCCFQVKSHLRNRSKPCPALCHVPGSICTFLLVSWLTVVWSVVKFFIIINYQLAQSLHFPGGWFVRDRRRSSCQDVSGSFWKAGHLSGLRANNVWGTFTTILLCVDHFKLEEYIFSIWVGLV